MTRPSRLSSAGVLWAALGSWALASSMTWAHAGAVPQIPVLGHALHRLGPVGMNGWGEADVDGDGRTDLVTSANGPAALILVYGRVSALSTLALKQTIYGPPGSIAALAVAPSGDTRVVTVATDRIVTRYGGWPLRPIGTFTVPHATRLARIGDIDADGLLELLCAGDGRLSAYVLADGTPKWSMTVPASDIALAALDVDPALELIIAGGDSAPGIVLDGATLLQEWARPEGFGTYVAAGVFGDPIRPGFVGARDSSSLTGFTAAPYAIDWNMSNFDTDGVAAGDTDADGRDEFAVGDGQWGSIRVYETPTRQILYELGNQDHGIWALGMLDFDADGRDELWYSARIETSFGYSRSFAAALMNPITARPRLTIESHRQGGATSLFADLEQDGDIEWIMGTGGTNTYQGLLRVFDATTQQEQWRAVHQNGVSFQPFQVGYVSLHAAQVDGDAALELVTLGTNGPGQFKIAVIDGATKQVERDIPPFNGSYFATVTASRLVQHVHGGAPELLVASHVYALPNSVKFDAYALPSGERIWSSSAVGGADGSSLGLDVGQLDADASPEYLLVHTAGLTAFDATSGATEWTLPIATQGAIIVPTASASAVLSFTTDGTVTRYDPHTQVAVGTFSLPAPLEQLARLPGRDDWLVAVSGERLKLITLDGQVLRESGWIGGTPGTGDNLHVVPDGDGWRISIGRSFTTFQLRLEGQGFVFENGFE